MPWGITLHPYPYNLYTWLNCCCYWLQYCAFMGNRLVSQGKGQGRHVTGKSKASKSLLGKRLDKKICKEHLPYQAPWFTQTLCYLVNAYQCITRGGSTPFPKCAIYCHELSTFNHLQNFERWSRICSVVFQNCADYRYEIPQCPLGVNNI